MKLLSVYIEAFGCFHQQTFDFNQNITCICENNGYGKTTLAAFIKAMFYGLPTINNNSKDFNDRMHYYPFEGGAYGGTIVFKVKNDIFKVNRVFNVKSATLDEITIYCNDKKIEWDKSKESLGKNIFSLDETSFLKTMFITSDDIEISSSSDISTKLNSFLDATTEVTYDKAIKTIKEKISEISKRNGIISLLKDKKKSLESKISNLQIINNNLTYKYEIINELEKEINSLTLQINEQMEKQTILAKWEYLDKLNLDIKDAIEQIKDINDKYLIGMPSKDEIYKVKELKNKLISLKEKVNALTLTNEEDVIFNNLLTVFKNSVVSEEIILAIQERIEEYIDITKEIIRTSEDTEEWLECYDLFEKLQITESIIEQNKANLNNYILCQENLLKQDNELSNKKNPLWLILIIVSLLVLCTGIGLLFVNQVVGIIISVVGFISSICIGFGYLITKVNGSSKVNLDKIKKQSEMETYKKLILEFLNLFNYNDDNIQTNFNILINDFTKYQEVVHKQFQRRELINNLEQKKKQLNDYLKNFFNDYFPVDNEDYKAYLNKLNDMKKDYFTLNKRINDNNINKEKIMIEINKNEELVKLFYSKYNYPLTLDIDEIDNQVSIDSNRLHNLKTNLDSKQKEVEEYQENNDLYNRPINIITDIQVLKDNLSKKTKEYNLIVDEVSNDETDVEELSISENDLKKVNDDLLDNNQRVKLLESVQNEITNAETSLRERYVNPIKISFIFYSDLLEKAIGEKLHMDENFQITFDKNGKLRSDKHLSSGQKAICSLCLRLALIKNMYTEEQPFIILDDPFVNFDEKHLRNLEYVIKELSKNNQLIYFCCHESRIIKE